MTLVFNQDRLPWASNGYLLIDWWTFEVLANRRAQ